MTNCKPHLHSEKWLHYDVASGIASSFISSWILLLFGWLLIATIILLTPANGRAQYRNGDRLRLSSSGSVFVVLDEEKCGIPSPEVYFRLYRDWYFDDQDGAVGAFPSGSGLSTDARLVKYQDSDRVFLVNNGEKRWIADPRTFELVYGFDWGRIETVTQNLSESTLPDGDDIRSVKIVFDGEWSPVERARVVESANLGIERMLKPNILNVAIENYSLFWMLYGTGPQIRSGGRRHDPMADNMESRIRSDIEALRKDGFPTLRIVRGYSADPWAGQAEVGTFVSHKEGEAAIGGEYRIILNAKFITDYGKNNLAGTIVHEMLHQMGHSHQESYTDGNFTTVFGDTIVGDGSYTPRERSGASKNNACAHAKYDN